MSGKFFFSKFFFLDMRSTAHVDGPPPENRSYQNRVKSRPNQAQALRDFNAG